MSAAPTVRVLCRLEDLPDGSSRSFSLGGDPCQEVFLVRSAGQIYAYRNSCPHTGAPLDWLPDQFLNNEATLIQCANHAALFRIEDGHCVAGPCAGAALTAVPVTVLDGVVILRLQDANPR